MEIFLIKKANGFKRPEKRFPVKGKLLFFIRKCDGIELSTAQKNKIPIVFIYNEITKAVIPIPIPPITPLNPPLGLIPPLPTSFADLRPVRDDLSKRSIPLAIMIGLASASEWAEAVTGSGELDVLRYGRGLKARQLVGVRGAGPAFDGLHYVTSVTHKIKRGEYKQSFQLSRNGLISTVPKVIP